MRSRHREVLMTNNQYGRPCPSVLRQQVPCPYRPCYEWRPSNWTECLLDGAQCGTGSRHQVMSCILAETGKTVSVEFCRAMISNRSRPSPMHVAETPCKVLCAFGKCAPARRTCAFLLSALRPLSWAPCCSDKSKHSTSRSAIHITLYRLLYSIMSTAEKVAKIGADDEEVIAGSVFPATVEDDISVYYYPSELYNQVWTLKHTNS